MILPSWTPLNIALTILYALLIGGMVAGEASGSSTMKYSKFFQGSGGIPSKTGMFWLYFVPFLAALMLSIPYLGSASPLQIFISGMVMIHFGKRVLETLFLHKYSGKIDIMTTLTILFFYTLVASGITYLNNWPATGLSTVQLGVGLVVYAVGILGNFFHHKILADLRSKQEGYVIPQGGLFGYVACPHYLFELIGWLGIAILSGHLFTWMSLAGMIGYLMVRSKMTLAWYQGKFPNYPKTRKAILPFLF